MSGSDDGPHLLLLLIPDCWHCFLLWHYLFPSVLALHVCSLSYTPHTSFSSSPSPRVSRSARKGLVTAARTVPSVCTRQDFEFFVRKETVRHSTSPFPTAMSFYVILLPFLPQEYALAYLVLFLMRYARCLSCDALPFLIFVCTSLSLPLPSPSLPFPPSPHTLSLRVLPLRLTFLVIPLPLLPRCNYLRDPGTYAGFQDYVIIPAFKQCAPPRAVVLACSMHRQLRISHFATVVHDDPCPYRR